MAQHKTNQHYKAFYVLLLCASVTCLTAYSQQNSKAIITGTTADSTGKALSKVPVTLLRLHDSSLVKAVISNTDGKYEFSNILPGSYFIATSVSN